MLADFLFRTLLIVVGATISLGLGFKLHIKAYRCLCLHVNYMACVLLFFCSCTPVGFNLEIHIAGKMKLLLELIQLRIAGIKGLFMLKKNNSEFIKVSDEQKFKDLRCLNHDLMLNLLNYNYILFSIFKSFQGCF